MGEERDGSLCSFSQRVLHTPHGGSFNTPKIPLKTFLPEMLLVEFWKSIWKSVKSAGFFFLLGRGIFLLHLDVESVKGKVILRLW